jgi:hypothetical protein
MEVKRSGIVYPVLFFFSAVMGLSVWSSALAQDVIKYLPRNEDMDSVVKEYSDKTISSVNCTKTGIFQEAANCYQCVQSWLPACDSCCFDSGGNLACARYTGVNATITEDVYSDANVTSLTDTGAAAYGTVNSTLSRISHYLKTYTNPKYTEKLACEANACGNSTTYENVCTNAYCAKIAANNNICNYNTTTKKCAALTNDCIDCLVGDCAGCFRAIDDDFSYKFVAKSREAITLIWQISSTPEWNQSVEATAPGYYLYTKVKVFERNSANPVFESVIHQKYLGAAFSIFCATHIPKESLTQGRAYTAKIYYYLANPAELSGADADKLKVKINSLRLIMVRIRE